MGDDKSVVKCQIHTIRLSIGNNHSKMPISISTQEWDILFFQKVKYRMVLFTKRVHEVDTQDKMTIVR